MLFDLYSILLGAIILFIGVLILLNKKNKKPYINYFLLMLFFAAYQRLLIAFNFIEFSRVIVIPEQRTYALLIATPVFYLFFEKLQKHPKSRLLDLSHVLISLIAIALGKFEIISFNLIFVIYSNVYMFFIFKNAIAYFSQKRTKLIKIKIYDSQKEWVGTILALSFFLYFIFNYFNYKIYRNPNTPIDYDEILNYASIIWSIVLFYIIRKPTIIYNEIKHLHLEQANVKKFVVWKNKINLSLEEEEALYYKGKKEFYKKLLQKLFDLESNPNFLRKNIHNIHSFSEELHLPKNQIKFLFKHFCELSKNDYFNLLRIKYALHLIDQGYLKDKTIESLAKACHFNSRTAFFMNFKKFIGVSVKEYRNILS